MRCRRCQRERPASRATRGAACAAPAGWSRERILFLLAGTVTLTGVLLTATVNQWFLLIPALVGANQLLMVTRGWCPVSLLLDRLGRTRLNPSSDPR